MLITSQILCDWPLFQRAFFHLSVMQRRRMVADYLGESLGRSLRTQSNQACVLIEEIWRGNIDRDDFVATYGCKLRLV